MSVKPLSTEAAVERESIDYCPIFADLRGRKCLLVGETEMARSKKAWLERAGARVCQTATFQEKEAADAFLIVADVDEREGQKIYDFGLRQRVFVNVVDKPSLCSFIVPALVHREGLLIGISTSGKSPALSGWLRRWLETILGREYGDLVNALGETRETVKEVLGSYSERRDFYLDLFASGFVPPPKVGKEEMKETLQSRLEEYRNARSRE